METYPPLAHLHGERLFFPRMFSEHTRKFYPHWIQKQDVVLNWNALQQQSYKQVMLFCQALVLMNADEKIKLDLTRLKEILPLPYKSFTQEDPQEFLSMTLATN